MWSEVSAGLRVCVLLTLGMVHMRDRVPYSVDSQPKLVPQTNATRYARGEIWWFENRDDISLMSTKIDACELNAAAAASRWTRRLGCVVQRSKLRARRKLTMFFKNLAQSTVSNYLSLRDALTGPSAVAVFLKITLLVCVVASAAVKLVLSRQYVYDTVRELVVSSLNFCQATYGYYFPRQPESSAAGTSTVYMSDDAREAIKQAKASSAAGHLDVDQEEPSEEVDVMDADCSSAAAHGGLLDEPLEAALASRAGRRQQADDDSTSTRVMSVLRAADAAVSDHHVDAAESAKKRVAFKDDIVDAGAEMGDRVMSLSPRRRPVTASLPPSHDDLSATPTGTQSPPPRPNRFGPRGRPGGGVGAAGRRPVAR